MSPPTDFHSPEQVAELLSLHVRTIRRLIREGKIAATKIGKQYRIPAAELERLVSGARVASVPRVRRVLVSSIVDIDAISRAESDRITTAVTGVFTSAADRTNKRIDAAYYEEQGRLRITIHADVGYTGALLGMIDAVLQDGRRT